MIQIKNGNVEMKGNGPELMADLSTIVHHLHFDVLIDDKGFSPEKSRKMILEAVEMAFMDDAEIEDKAKKALLTVLDMFKEFLTGKDEE